MKHIIAPTLGRYIIAHHETNVRETTPIFYICGNRNELALKTRTVCTKRQECHEVRLNSGQGGASSTQLIGLDHKPRSFFEFQVITSKQSECE